MSKWTPGPWHQSPQGTYVRYTQSDGTHPNIASLEVFGGGIDELEANARLIAKAPAMAEFLRRWANNAKRYKIDSLMVDEAERILSEIEGA